MATKTAILLVHGIGEMYPGYMLDTFVTGAKQFLPDIRYISDPGTNVPHLFNADNAFEIFEYHWADIPNKPEYQVDSKIVTEWFEKIIQDTLEGGKQIQKDLNHFDGWKWALVDHFIKSIYVTYPIFSGALKWLDKQVPCDWSITSLIKEQSRHFYEKIIGDAVLYTNQSSGARKEILDGLKEEIHKLLSGSKYDHIVIIGHSLGSVVAYDALSDIAKNEIPPIGRLVHFISLGSPLDKVSHYIKDYYDQDHEGIKDLLWFNYWCESDIVSGQLDNFKGVYNFLIKDHDSIFSHGDYLKNKAFYEHFYTKYVRAMIDGYYDE